MNKHDYLKMKIINRLLQESHKEDLQDFVIQKYFNQVINENNIILNESYKSEILITTSLIFSLLGLGLSAKDVSNNVAELVDQGLFPTGTVYSGTVVNKDQINHATDLINKTLKDYRKVAESLKLNSDELMLEYLNNLKKILDKANDSIKDYSISQDNVYLHSIYVTKVFASSPGLYRSFPSNGRYIKLNANQRNVLFYRLVVGKIPQFMKDAKDISKLNQRKIKLTDEEMEEVKAHEKWEKYSNDIKSIIKTNGDSYFHIWLNYGLAKVIKRIIGKSPKGSKKVSWCAANSGFVLSHFLAQNLEDIEQGKTSGSVWASTHKIYENYKNSNVLVFSKDNLSVNETETSRVAKISGVIIPGSFISTGKGKPEGTHAMMVINVDYENQTVNVVAGNHGNAVQLVEDIPFKAIQMVLNVPELGDPEKNTGVYKLSKAFQTLPPGEQEIVNQNLASIAALN